MRWSNLRNVRKRRRHGMLRCFSRLARRVHSHETIFKIILCFMVTSNWQEFPFPWKYIRIDFVLSALRLLRPCDPLSSDWSYSSWVLQSIFFLPPDSGLRKSPEILYTYIHLLNQINLLILFEILWRNLWKKIIFCCGVASSLTEMYE